MISFDSEEYWTAVTWDRFCELDRVSEAVRTEFLNQESLTVSRIARLCQGRRAPRIMDLACGTGKIALSILQAVQSDIHVTLVDFNSDSIALAKKNLVSYGNVDFHTLNAYEISTVFHHQFDAVVALDFVHHISRLDLLFLEIQKVLKPGGFLIGNTFAESSYGEWERLKHGYLMALLRRICKDFSRGVYGMSPTQIRKVIRRLGLARIDPLDRDELLLQLKQYFALEELVQSHYYWFLAKERLL